MSDLDNLWDKDRYEASEATSWMLGNLEDTNQESVPGPGSNLSKLQRITREAFTGQVQAGKFKELLASGWSIQHDKGTAHVSLVHESGGADSLLEVKTYGSKLTTGEADEVAGVIAELLKKHFGS